jgi:phosphate transport system permease protein
MNRALLLWRKGLNLAMLSLTGIAALLVVSILFFILAYLVWNGGSAINWDFFTRLPRPVGETGGGMANAIVGSAKTFSFVIRYTTDLLNGVPSIVIGIFAYSIVVLPVRHFSTAAGGVALGIMMIPIAVRTTEEFLRSVPVSLREAAMALGASKWKTIATVVVPASFQGILTGVMLDLARVAGETAPLLFTAFSNRFWSPGWNQPTASLPVMIFTYAIAPYEDWHRQAWAAGLVLLALILVANIGARLILAKGSSFRTS